jgi:hypothetical protein
MKDEDEDGGGAPATLAASALQALSAGLAKVVSQSTPRSGHHVLLRMQRDGAWVHGRDDTEVEEGSRWAVNPMALAHGFVCWARPDQGGGRKLGEVMTPITQPKPERTALEDLGARWEEQFGAQLKCVEGTDKSLQVLYLTSSQGGRDAMIDLLESIRQRLETVTDGTFVPVVELNSDSYAHPNYGKIWKPVLRVVDWLDMDGKGAAAKSAPATPPAPAGAAANPGAPVRRRRQAA